MQITLRESKGSPLTHQELDNNFRLLVAATIPNQYNRSEKWNANQNILNIPNRIIVNIGIDGFIKLDGGTIDLNTTNLWDDNTYQTPANRAGKDFYIYAATPTNNSITFDLFLSDDPDITTSRKIGGFHCLCQSVGTITMASGTPHNLNDYITGDILPMSVWDINHRPVSSPNGMVYDPHKNRWVMIYLASILNNNLASVYRGSIVSGTTTEKFHSYKFKDWFNRIGMELPSESEFFSFSQQSNQGTVISIQNIPTQTGGHVDTANRRMISWIGCEDCCGALWQWGRDRGSNLSTAYANAFDGNDSLDVRGQHYSNTSVSLFGGGGPYTPATCGSRGSSWSNGPLFLHANHGARGVSEPLQNF